MYRHAFTWLVLLGLSARPFRRLVRMIANRDSVPHTCADLAMVGAVARRE